MGKPLQNRQDPALLLISIVGGILALRSVFSLLFLPVPDRLPPIGFSLLLSFVSLGLFKLLQKVRRRLILDIVLSLGGIVLSSFLGGNWSSFLAGRGFTGFFPTGFLDGYALFLTVLHVGVHWSLGVRVSRMDTSHSQILPRFDSGIGLILFIAFLRWGIRMEDPYAFHTIGLYILFSLIALYRAKRREMIDPFHHPRSLLGSVGMFLILSSVCLVIALFSFPLLTYSADRVYRTAYALLSPLGPYLIRILRFLLSFTFARPAEPGTVNVAPNSDLPSGGDEPSWLQFIARLLGWGSLGVFILIGLVILVYLFKILIQALLRSRGEGLPLTLALKRLLIESIAHLQELFHSLLLLISQIFHKRLLNKWHLLKRKSTQEPLSSRDPSLQRIYREVTRSLKTLHKIGRLLGIKRQPSETLRQYVERLGRMVPRLKQPGTVIQWAVELFWYGPPSELDGELVTPLYLHNLRSARKILWIQVPASFFIRRRK